MPLHRLRLLTVVFMVRVRFNDGKSNLEQLTEQSMAVLQCYRFPKSVDLGDMTHSPKSGRGWLVSYPEIAVLDVRRT